MQREQRLAAERLRWIDSKLALRIGVACRDPADREILSGPGDRLQVRRRRHGVKESARILPELRFGEVVDLRALGEPLQRAHPLLEGNLDPALRRGCHQPRRILDVARLLHGEGAP
jgi:hypothetical protein